MRNCRLKALPTDGIPSSSTTSASLQRLLALVDHILQFLLELGIGFAFVGRQYALSVGEKEYYVDLLFYHLRLRCFVVIELKAVPFEPGFAGQLNFYTAVIDDKLRHPTDGPTIGLMLCRGGDRLTGV